MPTYRSRTTTHGRNQAGARGLWRATGMKDLGQLVAREIEASGGVAKEFNTIAVDDGIAMGHEGMLYSLPSRELIADAVEYMVNAHCADALVCISNCDKITPGMLMAALRLNLPTIFVSGGPMEAGKVAGTGAIIDAVDALVAGGKREAKDDELLELERIACPTCGSCAGMFTANSMNCLTEALGLALPGNGSLLATHARRENLFREAGRRIVQLTRRYYTEGDTSALPRAIATRAAFENAMSMDIAMGGSTNTILHLLAAAFEGDVPFTLADIDRLSRRLPHLCKVSPSTPRYHMEDVHRAGGVMGILGELDGAGLLDTSVKNILGETLADTLSRWDVRRTTSDEVREFYRAAPARVVSLRAFSQNTHYDTLDLDRAEGCIRDVAHAHSQDGGLAVLRGNLAREGCIVKTAGVDPSLLTFRGRARVFESENDTAAAIQKGVVRPGDVVVVRYEGPRGGPGMQEMLMPTSLIKAVGLATTCALVTDGRFSGASSGLSLGHVSPEAAEGGEIALVADGDEILIDIPNRTITLLVSDDELAQRRAAMLTRGAAAWSPRARKRQVSRALRAYASLARSASHGAGRDPSLVETPTRE